MTANQMKSKIEKEPKKFRCEDCDITYFLPTQLTTHNERMHRTLLTCKACPFKTASHPSLQEHIRTSHQNLVRPKVMPQSEIKNESREQLFPISASTKPRHEIEEEILNLEESILSDKADIRKVEEDNTGTNNQYH